MLESDDEVYLLHILLLFARPVDIRTVNRLPRFEASDNKVAWDQETAVSDLYKGCYSIFSIINSPCIAYIC